VCLKGTRRATSDPAGVTDSPITGSSMAAEVLDRGVAPNVPSHQLLNKSTPVALIHPN